MNTPRVIVTGAFGVILLFTLFTTLRGDDSLVGLDLAPRLESASLFYSPPSSRTSENYPSFTLSAFAPSSSGSNSSAETSSDERFLAMVRHFLEEFQGRAASTFDLKNIAESHMTDRMDVSGEGTLDWFFDQWVFGTGVPEYELTYSLDGGGSRVTASGRVQPANLPDFIVPLPLYARTGAALTYLGDVVVEGEGAEFFFALDSRPDELVLDPYHAVLRRGD